VLPKSIEQRVRELDILLELTPQEDVLLLIEHALQSLYLEAEEGLEIAMVFLEAGRDALVTDGALRALVGNALRALHLATDNEIGFAKSVLEELLDVN
jgi:hypothetical protein